MKPIRPRHTCGEQEPGSGVGALARIRDQAGAVVDPSGPNRSAAIRTQLASPPMIRKRRDRSRAGNRVAIRGKGDGHDRAGLRGGSTNHYGVGVSL